MSDTAQWTPDQPLRFDATDEQMYKRRIWIVRNLPLMNDGQISVKMAREFAHAQVAHLCETTNELLADWERRYAKLEEQVEAAAAGRGEETPDVWAVEWIGDGSHAPVLLRTILGTENQIRDLISKTMNDGYYRAVPLYLRPGRPPAEVPPTAEVTKLLRTLGSYVASANETAQRHLPIGTQELAREAMVMANALESQAAVWRSAQPHD